MTGPARALLCMTACAAGLAFSSGTAAQRSPDTPGYGERPPPLPLSQLLRRPGGFYTDDSPDMPVPGDLETLPDAEPMPEPLHTTANDSYTVFGRNYTPLHSAAGYKRQGTASWYGRKFHGQRTVSGEVYNMYAMTAAHPTLPIPSYARITNLENKRSVVVRINDRGPFGAGRIMDVSYAAAVKLGFAEATLAPVDVEGIATVPVPAVVTEREEPRPVIATASNRRGIFLQLGAFGSRANAESFRDRLQRQLDIKGEFGIELRDKLYRVQLGPYRDRAAANAVSAKIRASLEIKPVVVVR